MNKLPTPARWQEYAILLLLLLAFFIFKFPYFELPFFWDEAWVYAPATRHLVDHVPSILPNAMPADLSRGHPILFHFVAALWGKVFGYSPSSLHLYIHLVVSLLLVLVFVQLRKIANFYWSISIVGLLLVQPLFQAQASLLLPEAVLALLVLLAVLFYCNQKWWAYSATLASIVLIKETAFVAVFVLLVYDIARSLITRSWRWPSFIGSVIPVAVFGLFLITQKLMLGWYMYPEHIDMVELDYNTFKEKSFLIYDYLLERPRIYPITLIAFFTLALRKPWHWTNLLPVLLIGCGLKVYFNYWQLPEPLDFAVMTICLAVSIWLLFRGKEWNKLSELQLLALLIAVGFLVFSSLNFFTLRYALFALPLIAVVLLSFLYLNGKEWHPYTLVLLPALVIAMALKPHKENQPLDVNLNYKDAVETHLQLVHFLEDENMYDEFILVDFLDHNTLHNHNNGYRSNMENFTNLSVDPEKDHDYIITKNFGASFPIDSSQFQVVKSFEQGSAYIHIFKRME